MKNNIYLHELRIRWRSVLTWVLGLLGLHLLYLPFYSAFAADAEMLNQLMQQFPPEFLAAFGMTGINMATVLGYYSLIFTFAQVILSIQAANYGFGLLSVDEAELTADFLMSKPVSRARIWVSKVLAALTSLLVTQAAVWAIAFFSIETFRAGHPYEAATLVKILLSMFPFQVFFFSVGLAISMLVRRIRNVVPYGMGLGFGLYIINAFGDMLGESKLEWLSPFKHFDAGTLIAEGAYNGKMVALSVSVIVAALVIAYVRYLRRDIPSVT